VGRTGGHGARDERGSVQPLLAIVMGAIALALTLVVLSATVRIRVARAQWAADAAARAAAVEAVAGTDDGGAAAMEAAERLAEANGGRLVGVNLLDGPAMDYDRPPGRHEPLPVSPVIVVEIDVAGARARAGAARFAVSPG
jgi:hypothetical protein